HEITGCASARVALSLHLLAASELFYDRNPDAARRAAVRCPGTAPDAFQSGGHLAGLARARERGFKPAARRLAEAHDRLQGEPVPVAGESALPARGENSWDILPGRQPGHGVAEARPLSMNRGLWGPWSDSSRGLPPHPNPLPRGEVAS